MRLGRDTSRGSSRFSTPGCTFAWFGGGIESEYSGLDGFREGWLDIYEAWESARNQFEQIVPVGDKVLVLLRLYARIAGAEHDVETLAAAVFVVRDGRVARAEFYAQPRLGPQGRWTTGGGALVRRAYVELRDLREQHVERVAGDQRPVGGPAALSKARSVPAFVGIRQSSASSSSLASSASESLTLSTFSRGMRALFSCDFFAFSRRHAETLRA